MTTDQLIQLCRNQIADFKPAGKSFPFVRLTLAGAPRGSRRKLSQIAGAPFGDVLMEVPGNKTLCVFDAREVLAFCEKIQALPTT
jgi:hypothetical protein